MNVNEPKRASVGSSAATARARQSSEEDFHLAELVRSLRSLAADSPERQAKIEGLMRAYATGDLHVDADATASAIIDDALIRSSALR
jgi:anti-sigma28 factor (negative regulator of flagellin synthesis)